MDKPTNKHYFDNLYAKADDPWDFERSQYELAKYRHTLQAIPERTYQHALEIGCSIGVFTQMLAPLCVALTAIDISEKPLELARHRLREAKNVYFQLAAIPGSFPLGPYDLIVMSEVGYYLSATELQESKKLLLENLRIGGLFCAVHWRPAIEDCLLTGDEVHALFHDEAWQADYQYLEESYRIDTFVKK